MSDSSAEKITLYASKWCSHSRSIESYLERQEIPVHKINVDGDADARAELIKINDGYASVPTVIFADGTKLTEPSLAELRHKLGLEANPSLMGRIRGVLRSKSTE